MKLTPTQQYALQNLTIGDLDDPKNLEAVTRILDNVDHDHDMDCRVCPQIND